MLSTSHNGVVAHPNQACLILIHGAGGQKLDWPETWRTAQTRLTHSFSNVVATTRSGLDQCPVYALDLPGHGASSGPGHQDVASYAQAVLSCLKQLNLGPVILVGHSMGATVALQIALMEATGQANDTKAQILGLCLIAGGATFNVSDKVLGGLQTDFDATVDMLAEASWHRKIGVFGRQKTKLRMRAAGQETVYGDFLACSRVNLLPALDQLTLPVQIIAAADDVMVRLPILEETAAALPHAELKIVTQSGHFVHCEQTHEVADLLAKFSAQF